MTDNVKNIIDLIGSMHIISLFHDPFNEKIFEDDNYIYYISASKIHTACQFETFTLDYIYMAMMKLNINKQLATLLNVQNLIGTYFYKNNDLEHIFHNGIDYVLDVYDHDLDILNNLFKSKKLQFDVTNICKYISMSIDEFKDIELFIKVLTRFKSYIDFKLLLSNECSEFDITGEYRIALIRFIKDNNIIIDMEGDVSL